MRGRIVPPHARRSLAALLGLALSASACADDANDAAPTTVASGSGGATTSGNGGGGTGGEAVCGSANLPLDTATLTELAYHDGTPYTHLREQNLSVMGQVEHVFNDIAVHEAVRFELAHPARIHGFEVMWAGVDPTAAPDFELEAGLYPDFGYNGFDFWAADPLWTGTRCAADVDTSGSWTRYTFDTPITVDHPGLVYVAHRAAPGEPVWWFDETVAADDCSVFDDCQSAFNLPEAETNSYFNGLSFPFRQHFMVRLWVEYTDQLAAADTIFQAQSGPPANRHVSWGDYDNDGWDDLLLDGPELWRNDGNGSFIDVTTTSGLGAVSGTGGVWGDYDNDGCLDLFVYRQSMSQPDSLMRSNCDGTFSDATATAAIVDNQSYNDCGDPANVTSPTAAAAWADIDADGFLDLYLANYSCGANGTYYVDTVFMNDGDGTFTEVSAQNGFASKATASRGVAPIDYDADGDVDIFVNNYRLQANLFFDNDGDGSVTERALDVGLAGQLAGLNYFGHTIGSAWGDLDNDGDFDAIHANLAHPRFFDFSDKTQVLLNDGSGNFDDISGAWLEPASDAGLRFQETHSVPVLADFDNDGALDLAVTCVYQGRPSDFYWGQGDGTFRLDSYHAGITTEDGWGVAAADYDHDGDVDLFASGLFQNTATLAGHWLQARVVGISANRAGLGATVQVSAGGVTRMRHVQGGTGKGGQDSLYLHFGLGGATSVDEIRVTYPGGAEQVFAGPIAIDQRVWLYQDEAAPLSGWAPPK
jgi:hypothetical protein